MRPAAWSDVATTAIACATFSTYPRGPRHTAKSSERSMEDLPSVTRFSSGKKLLGRTPSAVVRRSTTPQDRPVWPLRPRFVVVLVEPCEDVLQHLHRLRRVEFSRGAEWGVLRERQRNQ